MRRRASLRSRSSSHSSSGDGAGRPRRRAGAPQACLSARLSEHVDEDRRPTAGAGGEGWNPAAASPDANGAHANTLAVRSGGKKQAVGLHPNFASIRILFRTERTFGLYTVMCIHVCIVMVLEAKV